MPGSPPRNAPTGYANRPTPAVRSRAPDAAFDLPTGAAAGTVDVEPIARRLRVGA